MNRRSFLAAVVATPFAPASSKLARFARAVLGSGTASRAMAQWIPCMPPTGEAFFGVDRSVNVGTLSGLRLGPQRGPYIGGRVTNS